MAKADKTLILFYDIETGAVVGEGELTPARARAIVKAYRVAGVYVEAVA